MLGKKFTDNINKESSQIKTSKVNYRMMLDKLITERPILRPLPPGEMLELKPYSIQLFERIKRFIKLTHFYKIASNYPKNGTFY